MSRFHITVHMSSLFNREARIYQRLGDLHDVILGDLLFRNPDDDFTASVPHSQVMQRLRDFA